MKQHETRSRPTSSGGASYLVKGYIIRRTYGAFLYRTVGKKVGSSKPHIASEGVEGGKSSSRYALGSLVGEREPPCEVGDDESDGEQEHVRPVIGRG